MKTSKVTIALALLFSSVVSSSFAQQYVEGKEVVTQSAPAPVAEDDWKFSFTPYLWVPGANLDISVPPFTIAGREFGGTINTDSSWVDVLGHLGSDHILILSADGRFEFSKGHWGGFADGYWIHTRVRNDGSSSHLILDDRVQVARTSSITERLDTGEFNFGPRYLFTPIPLSSQPGGPSLALEFYGGGRVDWVSNRLDGTVDLTAEGGDASTAGTFHFDRKDSRAFAEPMLGFRTTWTLGRDWVLLVRGDVGGFGLVANDNWDTDLEAGVGWQFHHNTFLDLAYRARGQWQDDGSSSNVTVKGWFHGPEVGVTFSF